MFTSKINSSSIILTLISPVLGLYYSIKCLSWQQRKWSLIFFITIYGFIMTIPVNVDAERHRARVYSHYVDLSFGEFLNGLWHIITLNPLPTTNDDVYIHVISYVTGGILGLPELFFAVVAFVFGYFYITALSKILQWDRRTKKPLIFIALVLLFIIYRGIDNLQTVRTWTGMWILFNGVFGYLQTKQKKYLWLMLAAPLVHAAYFVIALPAFITIFIKRLTPKVFIIIYITSFFVQVPAVGVIEQLNKTDLGRSKVDAYYREDPNYWDQREARKVRNWYTKFGKTEALIWGGNALAFTLILSGFYRGRMTNLEAGLFSTGLLMATFANLGSFIPSFHMRTMINAGLYILATTVLLLLRGELLNKQGFNLPLRKSMLWICILIFAPNIIFTLANIIQFTSIFILSFPMISWLSEEVNISIREVIGWFL